MKKGSITKYRLSPKRPPKTDWRAFDAMREEERHQAALSDPDAPPATDAQLARARRVPSGLEPLLHRGNATGRRHVLVTLAARLELLGGLASRLAELVERGCLLLRRLNRTPDPIDRDRCTDVRAARLRLLGRTCRAA